MFKPFVYALGAAAFLSACSVQSNADTQAGTFADALPTLSGDYVWTVDPDKSTLKFEADYNGVFTADFTRFAAAINLNPDAPEAGEIHAVVDLSSLSAADNDVKNNLPTPAWFDIKAHPVATFKSDDISKTAPGAFSAAGTMTLKGISNPAVLTFDLETTGDSAVADGRFTVNRTDYNVGTGSDFKDESWVKFPVKISMHIEASR